MVIPLSLLRAVDLRTETHALLLRAHVEAELGPPSDGLQREIMQLIVEAASLPNPSARVQEKISRAIELADEGQAALALSTVDEALRLRIPSAT
jgi:hypothetical protein